MNTKELTTQELRHLVSLVESASGALSSGSALVEKLEKLISSSEGFRFPTGIDAADVAGLLRVAFDADYTDYFGIPGDTFVPEDFDHNEAPEGFRQSGLRHCTAPLMGGYVELHESEPNEGEEPQVWRLDGAAIQRGIDLLPVKLPDHYARAIKGPEHVYADSGELFIQLCLFGEERYC